MKAMLYDWSHIEVEYHANENPLTYSEKIAYVVQKVNVSNNGKKIIPYNASLF